MQPHTAVAQQMPLQQSGEPGVHAVLSGMHWKPPSGGTPPSGTGGPTSLSTHCAMWLCDLGSWNGSQKAGKLESTLVAAAVRSIAAIHSCGCRQLGSASTILLVEAFSGDSGG